jgi:curli biogenesis system outer membrane secretion channel CsgG
MNIMEKNRYSTLLLILAFLGIAQITVAQNPTIKKRVAVFVFEDKTDKSWHWWNNKGVGEGMSDMLTTELVKSGEYTVIERSELDKILAEQALGASGAVTAQTAAEIGKLLGVELAVMGSVTEFGYTEDKKGGRLGGIGVGVSNQSAIVGVDVRLVNTSTGEILAADNVRREKASKGISVDTRTFDFSDQKKFDESLVGKAAREAVEDITSLVNKQMPNIPWQGKVVTEQNGTVFINAGSNLGIKVGDVFHIYMKGEALIDPDTGLSLGSEDTKIGEVKVTDAGIGQGKASKCQILNGSGFKPGYIVRLP